MNQVALILSNTTIYWYCVVLALSLAAGACLFMGFCLHREIPTVRAAGTVCLAVCLSLAFSRLLYWHCRADSFENLLQAMTTPAVSDFALAGTFAGCGLAVVLLGRVAEERRTMLDCMSLAGCAAIALGRLGGFFTTADRGQILTELTNLPWAYPVANAASGEPEYRLATFLFQAVIAGALFCVLAVRFFSRRKNRPGDITLLFLLGYSASQVLLDSTRYDSLYLRSNGFVSVVQIFAAVTLAACLVLLAVRAAKNGGIRKWMVAVWALLVGLFACAGYMEYFVQRHGRLAFFAYCVMEHCLVGILACAALLWRAWKKETRPNCLADNAAE